MSRKFSVPTLVSKFRRNSRIFFYPYGIEATFPFDYFDLDIVVEL
jgi:hypothetical protein